MNYVGLFYDGAEQWLSEAAASTKRDVDQGLDMALSMACKGQEVELVEGAPRAREFEAWKRSVQEFGLP